MPGPPPLPPDVLCRRCDPDGLPFATTADLADLDPPLGQERAEEAVRFGVGMRREGYNLFVMGPPETGKRTLVRSYLGQRAASDPVPPDLCYLHNFQRSHQPIALSLPAGRGPELRKDLEDLVKDLRTAIPASFESDEQRNRKQVIEEEIKERHEKAMEGLRERAKERGLALLQTPVGFAFAPLKDGQVIDPEEFEKLPAEERQRLEGETGAMQGELQGLVQQFQGWAREARDKLKDLLRDITRGAVQAPIDELAAKWREFPALVAHLAAIRDDIVENVADFVRPSEPSGEQQQRALGLPEVGTLPVPAPLRRYLVNVLVENGGLPGAPVVFEDQPTYQNLVGRVEHLATMGALVTDFHLIKAGALHRANGGYLVLEARNVLLQPYAWEELKRTLRSRRIRIGALGQMLSLVSTVSLEPEPFPLQVKVVLLGDRQLYYLLDHYDPDFQTLFKVVADFEDEFERTPGNDLLYARLIATTVRRDGLRPFDRCAVARVLERSSRLAGDSARFTTHLGALNDLLREADYHAGEAGNDVVGEADVRAAIAAGERREGRVRERVLEQIGRGTVRIETAGARVGQVNALSVLQLGRFAFGRPSRVTARVRLGRGEVIDIEREVTLGGPLHSKGVLILSAFLGARYAADHPMSLAATLAFEQSYGPVEGDSASCAELCALLSALSEVPLRQSLAITGSVDQHGQVQPIGGVNEKIEGFFDVCAARGLDGSQGVIVPETNVKHLMLRPDLVEAVRDGRFSVWAVTSVDEALELLTGLDAGERDGDGRFPPGSINARVEARLIGLAERRLEAGRIGEVVARLPVEPGAPPDPGKPPDPSVPPEPDRPPAPGKPPTPGDPPVPGVPPEGEGGGGGGRHGGGGA